MLSKLFYKNKIYRNFIEYLHSIVSEMYHQSPLSVVESLCTGTTMRSLNYYEIINLSNYEMIQRKMVDDIFRGLERLKDTPELLKRILKCGNIDGKLAKNEIEKAMKYIDLRHLFIHHHGKFDELYIEKYKQLRLECYNSQEVGYTLAKYFLQTIDSQLNVDAAAFDDKKLPTFYLPLPIGCYLPGDYILYKAKSAKETNPKISKQDLNRQPLVYNKLDQGGCYLSFSFNIFGIIDSVVYLGKEHIDYRSLVSLVGLHETYLNKILNRFEGKLVEDIPGFLSENWALALYHDKFSQLVIKLKAIYKYTTNKQCRSTQHNNNFRKTTCSWNYYNYS